jgi:hypothetical protein
VNRRIPHYRNNKLKKKDYLLLIKYFLRLVSIIATTLAIICVIALAFHIKQKYDVIKPVNFAIVYRDQIKILKYDNKSKEILLLKIEGDTIFDTSGKMGEYPAKSLYDLSLNEKRGSELLRITLMKNLHLPIYEVIDCRNIIGTETLSAINVLKCKNSKIEDLLYISYILGRVGNNKIMKELGDYQVLKSDANLDGYRINDNVFNKLEFDFSADSNIKDVISVEIEAPEGSYVPKYFDDIIKITGGRVVRTANLTSVDVSADCTITSNSKDYLKYMKTIFRCAVNYSPQAKETIYKFSRGYLDIF